MGLAGGGADAAVALSGGPPLGVWSRLVRRLIWLMSGVLVLVNAAGIAPGLVQAVRLDPRYAAVGVLFAAALLGVPRAVDRIGIPGGTLEFGGKELAGAFSTRELHFGRFYTQLSLDRFTAISHNGGSRSELPDKLKAPCWLKHSKGTGDVMGRLTWDKPSVTIRTEFFKPEKGRYIHPDEDRVITHYEAALLQGFRKGYRWVGTREEIARQIGNAVPIPLGAAIGRLLIDAFDGAGEIAEAVSA